MQVHMNNSNFYGHMYSIVGLKYIPGNVEIHLRNNIYTSVIFTEMTVERVRVRERERDREGEGEG